jgi:hypothetical protein
MRPLGDLLFLMCLEAELIKITIFYARKSYRGVQTVKIQLLVYGPCTMYDPLSQVTKNGNIHSFRYK